MTAKNNMAFSYYRISLHILVFFLVLSWLALIPYFPLVYGVDGLLKGTDRVEQLVQFLGRGGAHWLLRAVQYSYPLWALGLLTKWRRLCALVLLGLQIFLFNWNSLTLSPECEFIGFLLFVLFCVPESYLQDEKSLGEIKKIGWWVLGIGYLVASYSKWNDQVWRSGEAIDFILNHTPVTTNYGRWLGGLGLGLTRWITYAVLAAESFFLLALFYRPIRTPIWSFVVFIHLQILLAMPIWEVPLGMIVYHLFIIDSPRFMAWAVDLKGRCFRRNPY